MAAASTTVGNFGRQGPGGNPRFVPFTLTLTATVVTTASGGVPIDLANVLLGGADFNSENINPADLVCILQVGVSTTNSYTIGSLTFNPNTTGSNPVTYTTPPGYPFEPGGATPTERIPKILATAPAWLQILAAGVLVVNTTAVTDTFNLLAVFSPSGPNN